MSHQCEDANYRRYDQPKGVPLRVTAAERANGNLVEVDPSESVPFKTLKQNPNFRALTRHHPNKLRGDRAARPGRRGARRALRRLPRFATIPCPVRWTAFRDPVAIRPGELASVFVGRLRPQSRAEPPTKRAWFGILHANSEKNDKPVASRGRVARSKFAGRGIGHHTRARDSAGLRTTRYPRASLGRAGLVWPARWAPRASARGVALVLVLLDGVDAVGVVVGVVGGVAGPVAPPHFAVT